MVYIFLMCILNARYVQMPPQDFLIFAYEMLLSLVYIGYESGGNDLKATGDVATFI